MTGAEMRARANMWAAAALAGAVVSIIIMVVSQPVLSIINGSPVVCRASATAIASHQEGCQAGQAVCGSDCCALDAEFCGTGGICEPLNPINEISMDETCNDAGGCLCACIDDDGGKTTRTCGMSRVCACGPARCVNHEETGVISDQQGCLGEMCTCRCGIGSGQTEASCGNSQVCSCLPGAQCRESCLGMDIPCGSGCCDRNSETCEGGMCRQIPVNSINSGDICNDMRGCICACNDGNTRLCGKAQICACAPVRCVNECPEGQAACIGECCKAGEFCNGISCMIQSACPAGQEDCGSGCCDSTQYCEDGECKPQPGGTGSGNGEDIVGDGSGGGCSVGQIVCGSGCCASATQYCEDDECKPAPVECPEGQAVCGGGCCADGMACIGESCIMMCSEAGGPCGGNQCCSGLSCVDGACAVPCSEAGGPCGGNQCCSGLTCMGAVCTEPCAGSFGICGAIPCCEGLACMPWGMCFPSGGCFLPGTLVQTPEGGMLIENIKAGDRIYSFSENGEVSVSNVLAKYAAGRDAYYMIRAGENEVNATAEHPFLTQNGYKEASSLAAGDVVFIYRNGALSEKTVTSVSRVNAPAAVYNLQVDGSHTFFANGFAVHNKPM